MRDLQNYLPNLANACAKAMVDPPEIIVEDQEFDDLATQFLKMQLVRNSVQPPSEQFRYHGICVNRRHDFVTAPFCPTQDSPKIF